MTRRVFLIGSLIPLSGGQTGQPPGKPVAGSTPQTPVTPNPPVPGFRLTDKGEPVVPLIFPVLNGCEWEDTYGFSRDGGKRKHLGQDLPAEKMRPLLACFDGIWTGMAIRGNNGCTANYYHLNNDTPGTDDGKGGEEFRVAPGIWQGVPVIAGQHVAYCGDSGNAEETISHLHFELNLPGVGVVNALASLRVAPILKEARYTFEDPEFHPEGKALRIDAEVVSVNTNGQEMVVRVAAWANSGGKVTPNIHPLRRTIRQEENAEAVRVGDFIAALGNDPGDGKPFAARKVKVLRHLPPPPARPAKMY